MTIKHETLSISSNYLVHINITGFVNFISIRVLHWEDADPCSCANTLQRFHKGAVFGRWWVIFRDMRACEANPDIRQSEHRLLTSSIERCKE